MNRNSKLFRILELARLYLKDPNIDFLSNRFQQMSIIYCKNSKILGKRVCTTAIFSFMIAFIALKGCSFQNLFNALNGSQVSIIKINSERMWFDPANPNIIPTYFFFRHLNKYYPTSSQLVVFGSSSRKHAYIVMTPLKPTFI